MRHHGAKLGKKGKKISRESRHADRHADSMRERSNGRGCAK